MGFISKRIRASIGTLIVLPVLALFVVIPVPASAATADNAVARVSLVADPRTDRPFTVAIVIELDPEWHIYWKNPGDAGMATRVRWRLPSGWQAGYLHFPTPKAFVTDGILSYGYSDRVVLLQELTPGDAEGPLEVDINWLACKELCAPGHASVTLPSTRPSRDERRRIESIIDSARDALPKPASSVSIAASRAVAQAIGNDRFEVTVPLTGANARRATGFFPEKPMGVLIDYPSIRVSNSALHFTCRRENTSGRRFALKGILVTPLGAFNLLMNIPLPNTR